MQRIRKRVQAGCNRSFKKKKLLSKPEGDLQLERYSEKKKKKKKITILRVFGLVVNTQSLHGIGGRVNVFYISTSGIGDISNQQKILYKRERYEGKYSRGRKGSERVSSNTFRLL